MGVLLWSGHVCCAAEIMLQSRAEKLYDQQVVSAIKLRRAKKKCAAFLTDERGMMRLQLKGGNDVEAKRTSERNNIETEWTSFH